MERYVLAIDQGTTGTTVSIVNESANPIAKINEEYRQIFPNPGWVEHDPEDIWKSTESTISKALTVSGISPKQIAAIGITNQRETVMVWDRKTGKSIYNAIVWQCRRTTEFCNRIKKDKNKVSVIKKKTGLVVDPYFSGSKIRWILDKVKGSRSRAKSGELAVGTVDTFLLWRLTDGLSHATDVSNASRTQLMNIKTAGWDSELLKIFGVPKEILPEIKESNADFGRTKGLSFLPDGIPICGIAGDQQAALFGQACFSVGEAKCTFGTGSFILMNTGDKPVTSKNCLTTIAWKMKGDKKPTYALEGSVFICGAAVQWLRDSLGIIKKSSDVEELANQVESTEGVEFVPALSGLGAPYWRPEARGIITGLTRGSTRAHIARATLEAMALQNCEILWAMEKDSKKKLKNLKVDGGASANNTLMQIQADYLGAKVIRPEVIETTAMGAAFLAGIGAGVWKSREEVRKVWSENRSFTAKFSAQKRKERLKNWKSAVERA
ncbi:MAG: glycerol kinase GlpK [Bdellovibrionales bacterium]|nr:glycerol kinase GlpK [Bdellovibrionales bacterium]